MKYYRKLVSIILTLALVLAMSPASFAGTVDNVKQYDVVCCIGDSVSTGYCGAIVLGNQTNNRNLVGQTTDFIFKTTDEAFASLVSKTVHAKKYYNLTCVGLRTTDVLFMLNDPEYKNYNINKDKAILGDAVLSAVKKQKNRYTAEGGMTAEQKIKASDMVIIQLGSNDAFTAPLFGVLFSGKLITPSKIIDAMKKGSDTLIENYPKLLKRIKELNPDATIVVLNQFCPFDCLAIRVLGKEIKIGETITERLSKNNHYYEDWANEYGAVFVDITGVSKFFDTTVINDKDFNFMTFDTHFGPDGHEYVAEQIIKALPEAKTYIREPQEGLLNVNYYGMNAGNYTFTKVPSGWLIQNEQGKYVCFNHFRGITLRFNNPTIWKYDGGFYTGGVMLEYKLGMPIIKNGKQYLSLFGKTLVSSSIKTPPALFAIN